MKIAIGMQPYPGPWGGGNRFVSALSEGAKSAGHTIVHTLDDPDIDIILLVDPRVRSPNVTFGAGMVFRYLAFRNPRALVIHRINECDERKAKGHRINGLLRRANYTADATVFVASWLADLPVWRHSLREPWFTILNGADTRVFHSTGFMPWSGIGPIRLVTHHWGSDRNKGFDVYEYLDCRLADAEFSARFAFTYIGNLPKGFKFRHTNHVRALDGDTLASELRRHHAYLTASINEPGGNHQNEGALCGLPLIYRRSGCMPEYCRGYGIAFDGPGDLESALDHLVGNYSAMRSAVTGYPHTAEVMVKKWINLFERLYSGRDEIARSRRLWREPVTALSTQLPF